MAAELLFALEVERDVLDVYAWYASRRVIVDASRVMMARSYAADKLDRLSEISCGAQRI